MPITKTYDMLNLNGVKGWIRDSWARRKIVELQTAVSGLTGGKSVPYGYCTTAAATVAKVVTVSPAVTELSAGTTVAVKFQYANTASNPTINVNGLGAKAIKRYGTTAAGTSAAANWNANSVVMLTYDGTYWMLADWNNTTYSGMSDAEYQAGTGTSNRLITPARLKAAILLHAPVQSVNGQTGAVTVSVPTKTSDLTNDSGFITSAPVASVNGQTGAVTLDAMDVGALPDTTPIPSKTSDLTNDAGYITGYTETDPTVPAWAKAASKPSYTASEVGALPSTTVIPAASSVTPAMDGIGAAGSATDYARADHAHPSDTAKQDALTSAQLAAVNSGITADDIAVNDPNVLCPVTPIVPTLTNGSHNTSNGGCYYYKIGHRVTVHISVGDLTAKTKTNLWVMPEGYRPRAINVVNGMGQDMPYIARMRVSTNGQVSTYSESKYAFCETSYDVF